MAPLSCPLPPGPPPEGPRFAVTGPPPFSRALARKQGLGGLEPSRSGQGYPVESRKSDMARALSTLRVSPEHPPSFQ